MAIIIFGAGTSQTAKARITVKPEGLNCGVELWLSINDTTQDARAAASFISTGSEQEIPFSIVMPTNKGYKYHINLDITVGAMLLAAFEDVNSIVLPFVSDPTITWA